jgi:hypothetical protein
MIRDPLLPKHARNPRVADSLGLAHGDVVVKPAVQWRLESWGDTSNARKQPKKGQGE